jgi:hypothetical protein
MVRQFLVKFLHISLLFGLFKGIHLWWGLGGVFLAGGLSGPWTRRSGGGQGGGVATGVLLEINSIILNLNLITLPVNRRSTGRGNSDKKGKRP